MRGRITQYSGGYTRPCKPRDTHTSGMGRTHLPASQAATIAAPLLQQWVLLRQPHGGEHRRSYLSGAKPPTFVLGRAPFLVLRGTTNKTCQGLEQQQPLRIDSEASLSPPGLRAVAGLG